MRTVVVVVDTTEFYKQLELRGRAWDQLFRLTSLPCVQVVVPRAVVREAGRHYRRQATQLDRTTITQLQDALKQLGRVTSVPRLNLGQIRRELLARRESFETFLENELKRRGAEIAEVPALSNETLLDWAITERQPFKSNGEGFRDSLVWGTILEIAGRLSPMDLIIFVTANTADFCDNDGQLGRALLGDLEETLFPPQVLVAADLGKALGLLQPEADALRAASDDMRKIEAETLFSVDAQYLIEGPVLYACENLTGQVLTIGHSQRVQLESRTGSVGVDAELPPDLDDASVYELEPTPESLIWNAYDEYVGGVVLGTAAIRATLTISGTIPFSELESTEQQWSLDYVEADAEDDDQDDDPMRSIWITFSIEVELVFHLSVNVATQSVDDIELESVKEA